MTANNNRRTPLEVFRRKIPKTVVTNSEFNPTFDWPFLQSTSIISFDGESTMVMLSPDRRVLHVAFDVKNGVDQIRVLVDADKNSNDQ